MFEVSDDNYSPMVAKPLQDQRTRVNRDFTYTFPADTFTDADAGDMLTYEATSLPGWLSFDPATRTFSGTPGSGDVGTLTVDVTASDGAASVSGAFDIEVLELHRNEFLLTPVVVRKSWPLTPSDVSLGDEFRLIFLSSIKRTFPK